MACHNCEDGKVALTNNDGQVYEFRNCPLCTCRLCDGAQYVEGWNPEPGPRKRVQPCRLCHPGRFDAHVRLWHKQWRPQIIGTSAYGDPSPAALQRNVEEFLNPPPEYYERIYRRCLNPFQRFCRWLTHNPDGSKRNG